MFFLQSFQVFLFRMDDSHEQILTISKTTTYLTLRKPVFQRRYKKFQNTLYFHGTIFCFIEQQVFEARLVSETFYNKQNMLEQTKNEATLKWGQEGEVDSIFYYFFVQNGLLLVVDNLVPIVHTCKMSDLLIAKVWLYFICNLCKHIYMINSKIFKLFRNPVKVTLVSKQLEFSTKGKYIYPCN